MRRAIHVDGSEQAVRDLLEMLHKGATADDFAARLAELDALPASYPGKSALVETVRMAMAVRNRLELQEQRERGLLAVISSAQDQSSRLGMCGTATSHRHICRRNYEPRLQGQVDGTRRLNRANGRSTMTISRSKCRPLNSSSMLCIASAPASPSVHKCQ